MQTTVTVGKEKGSPWFDGVKINDASYGSL